MSARDPGRACACRVPRALRVGHRKDNPPTGGAAMADRAGNQTPNTPGVSETELRHMKVDELREAAKEEGISGTSGMRREDLGQAVAGERSSGADTGSNGEAGTDEGGLRTGPDTSDSLQ